jgi:hypothetical protein
VKTTRNELYSVDRFEKTDSTLVVESVIPLEGVGSDGTDFTKVNPSDLPFEILYTDIEDMRGMYVTEELKIVVLSAIGVAAGIGLFVLFVSTFAVQ